MVSLHVSFVPECRCNGGRGVQNIAIAVARGISEAGATCISRTTDVRPCLYTPEDISAIAEVRPSIEAPPPSPSCSLLFLKTFVVEKYPTTRH